MSYLPIEQHGVIGDLDTVALVGTDGCIDFMCFPHFDSPSIFAALLDDERGGHFRIAPQFEAHRQRQLYHPDTAVLFTRFLSDEGVAEVSDFMPIHHGPHSHRLVRRAKTVRGEVRFRMTCAPRFDYGRAAHRAEHDEETVLFISEGPRAMRLRLRSDVPLHIDEGDAVAEFTLGVGETAAFVLEEAAPGYDSPSAHPDYVSRAFKETVNYWRAWVGRSNYEGRWREVVNRSALTLKLLTSRHHGSIVAAPTFGLPEHVGGERNWDYRYTWIRDATFTLYALIRLGYTDEADAFMRWIEARCEELADGGALQIMYGLGGERELTERTLDHFEGYRGSQPVRIGNGAYDQLQLDIYGELMDAVYLYDKYGTPISYDLWRNLVPLVDWVCANWEQPDEGIWEVRSGRRHFLSSRVLCWVAVDRAVRLARKRGLPAPTARWAKTRDTIYRDIHDRFWSDERQAFVQSRDGDVLDAAALLMPLLRFISPTDPRWRSTLAAIEGALVDDSLVFRYSTEHSDDGLEGAEGTFSICSFWYVECLSRAGDLDKARFVFEKMLGYANHVGLYAEELGRCAEHLGNFPQAFTHLGLISAAYDLNRRLEAAGRRG